jgi:hypothetical protein
VNTTGGIDGPAVYSDGSLPVPADRDLVWPFRILILLTSS